MRRYTLFYADGALVEGGGEDDELITLNFTLPRKWLEAPNDGLVAAVQENAYVCRKVHMGRAYYIMLPKEGENTIYQPERDDLGPYLRTWLGGMVKFGQIVGDEAYHELRAKLNTYQGIPRDCERKTANP